MDEFVKEIGKINIPITITQIEMNKYTCDKLLRDIPDVEQSGTVGYIYSFTGIPIVTNDDLKDGEVKTLYSDGKYKTVLSIDTKPLKKTEFKMEYECKWI